MADLAVRETNIPGMFVIDLPLHGDSRGWFKENYQKAKMEALGLPVFEVVQNNFSFNTEVGVTRGLHAEPWEKFISLGAGKAFGAWVDLRPGTSFGQTFVHELRPDVGVFVPRGVANGYQTLEPNVVYSYLVNEHWSPEVTYNAVQAFDPALKIDWPIARDKSIISDKDQVNPLLADVTPMEV